ncbi:phosphoenolpyruvate carboxylase-related kinase 2 [Actinidia rufa]|uniref:Phosphoenolpyruvate carboxylase-related kinase 2 n=1 Tax=Actinidia rufa TaxID=165716 RepID=A0A7J0FBL1_9ERIC|nr:phosphoenolpyruvate carboxylase-related kinase 2 [Actinidia rufa]
MRRKRKGSEILCLEEGILESTKRDLRSSLLNLKCHYSLEDYARLKKRCKEDNVGDKTIGSCKSRLVGIAATAPPCGTSSVVSQGRGLKRKIGCIDVATQMGRKNKIEDDYDEGPTIGKGKFGSVWLCRHRVAGVEFACKTLCKKEETVHREVEIMQHLSGHPGVVTLKAVYEDSECFHLVMELCSGGRLIDQMAKEVRYSEHRAANIFKELMLVIKYCHDMGVVHRDIKPENILLTTSGKIKLADFGLTMRVANGNYLSPSFCNIVLFFMSIIPLCYCSFTFKCQRLTGLAGSPGYVAPEVLLGNYCEKVDIWSAGVLLHTLLTGALPFQGGSLEAVFEAIQNVNLDFHTGIWESISKPARDLMERTLSRDVATRITADEVLSHPWILFYTERTLRTLSIKPKLKSHPTPPSQLVATTARLEPKESRSAQASFSGSESSETLPGRSGCKREEQDDCGLVDVLAVAISHVTISEPKKSRLCGPTSPIREQCSSNMTANNLCKAF